MQLTVIFSWPKEYARRRVQQFPSALTVKLPLRTKLSNTNL